MNILSISQARGIIFALFLSLSFTSSQSQNLTDQMGGVKTNYRIIAGYSELKTVNQAIFKRTITINHQDNHSKHSRIENKEVYVLEFISTDRMYISDRVRFKYWLELWDENNQILLNIRLNKSRIKTHYGQFYNTYTLNLQDIPLVNLDMAKTIRFRLITTSLF